MNMNCVLRFEPVVVAICGLLALGNVAVAATKANHHDAKRMVGENLKQDGRHDIDHKGKYTTAVEVRNGKVAAVHVKHSEKGEISVKKYKTHRKMAQSVRGNLVYASYVLTQNQDLGTVYIGYSYVDDDGNEEIYWFPEEMILDGETGAVEYVPTN
jgi:hypothetical protein